VATASREFAPAALITPIEATLGLKSILKSDQSMIETVSLPQYLGVKPLFWCREFGSSGQRNIKGHVESYYSSSESDFLRSNNIRVLPIARQSSHVNGSADEARFDAARNVAAIFEVFPPAYLSGADPDILVFLAIEQDAPVTTTYYAAWSAAIIETGMERSNGRVRLHPAVYSSYAANETWAALRCAIGDGAVCDGALIARCSYPSPAPRPWCDQYVTPAGGLTCPILGWQYWCAPIHAPPSAAFDAILANPAHADMLLSRLVLPPSAAQL
jgi:hypothetical protein